MTLSRIIAISDFCTHVPPLPVGQGASEDPGTAPRAMDADVPVRGGYLERLPLAAVRAGLVRGAEIWSFCGTDHDACGVEQTAFGIDHRRFRAEGHGAPYASRQMAAHLRQYGAPDILCVWGLGISEDMLDLCRDSILIYNSLDVDAMRVPPEESRHFDIFLCGSTEQVEEVRSRHPRALAAVLPIGPEFASPETFYPLAVPKTVDLIYVAAAQSYKRHDILFDALAVLPPDVSALCVMGYGEDAGALRDIARNRQLNVTFVGPPGVTHDEVNRLMNSARIGLVCGVDDGAPAILTEYMLAGLPVLANAHLRCGLQFIRPDTGIAVPAEQFPDGIRHLLQVCDRFETRQAVLENWSWDHSVNRLASLVALARARRGASDSGRLRRS